MAAAPTVLMYVIHCQPVWALRPGATLNLLSSSLFLHLSLLYPLVTIESRTLPNAVVDLPPFDFPLFDCLLLPVTTR
jgi:hypothetical protein